MLDSHHYHSAEFAPPKKRARVLIVQPVVPHYRLKLYELLYERLRAEGIALQVAYGQPHPEAAAKRDLVDLPASIGLKINNYWFLSGKLLYQPILREALSADLVIVLNANGHLLNYLLSVISLLGRPKLAFWVWWRHLRSGEKSFGERLRRQITRTGCWWFAYTAGTRDYLLLDGMPSEQISVLYNSVDVSGFRLMLATVSDAELKDFADFHRIPTGSPVGLFCGGLYPDKRLAFLFEAAEAIQATHPDFHLLVVGDGIERHLAIEAAARNPHIHYLGPRFGREKALCFKLAKLFLCPGLVGLAILDAFTAGLPLITTDTTIHSPEIEYLQHGGNGLLLADDVSTYADAVLTLLQPESTLHALSDGALTSSRQYSIENMAEQFAEGIIACLKSA